MVIGRAVKYRFSHCGQWGGLARANAVGNARMLECSNARRWIGQWRSDDGSPGSAELHSARKNCQPQHASTVSRPINEGHYGQQAEGWPCCKVPWVIQGAWCGCGGTMTMVLVYRTSANRLKKVERNPGAAGLQARDVGVRIVVGNWKMCARSRRHDMVSRSATGKANGQSAGFSVGHFNFTSSIHAAIISILDDAGFGK